MHAWLIELWAAPAALGFALLFNVPTRALAACGVLAILGHACRKLVMDVGGADIVFGTLIAALLIGLVAEWWGRRQRDVPLMYAITAAIPMVPGTYMYKAVQGLLGIAKLQAHAAGELILVSAGVNIVKASMIVLALAFGIAAPHLFWPKPHHH